LARQAMISSTSSSPDAALSFGRGRADMRAQAQVRMHQQVLSRLGFVHEHIQGSRLHASVVQSRDQQASSSMLPPRAVFTITTPGLTGQLFSAKHGRPSFLGRNVQADGIALFEQLIQVTIFTGTRPDGPPISEFHGFSGAWLST
jgi:hypothetical protein